MNCWRRPRLQWLAISAIALAAVPAYGRSVRVIALDGNGRLLRDVTVGTVDGTPAVVSEDGTWTFEVDKPAVNLQITHPSVGTIASNVDFGDVQTASIIISISTGKGISAQAVKPGEFDAKVAALRSRALTDPVDEGGAPPQGPGGNPACGAGAGGGNTCDQVAGGIPGCTDDACCNLVCGCDPFCCDTDWDVNCVGPNGFVAGCSWLDLCQGPVLGACCDPAGPSCVDNVEQANCAGQFTPNTLCSALNPACGDAAGACTGAIVYDNGEFDLTNGTRPSVGWSPDNGIVDDLTLPDPALNNGTGFSCVHVDMFDETGGLPGYPSMRARIYALDGGGLAGLGSFAAAVPVYDETFTQGAGSLVVTDTGSVGFGFPVLSYEGTGAGATLAPGNYGLHISFPGTGATGFWATAPGDASECAQVWGADATIDLPSDACAGGGDFSALSFRLLGDPVEQFGACCDDATGVCDDNISSFVCTGRFVEGTLCANIDPLCGQIPEGACCNADASCDDGVQEADCQGVGRTWQGDGVLCAATVCPENNDFCDSAEDISGEGTFPFDNTTATEDGPADCQKAFGDASIPNDVWFCWESPCTGEVILSTCDGLAAGIDTKVAVYDGCACFGPQLACDDDGCSGGAPFDSLDSFNAVTGQSYLIRIGVFPAGVPVGGAGEFSLTCVAPTGACCDGGDCTPDLTEADCTAGGGSYAGDGVSCDAGGAATIFSSSPGLAIPDGTGPGVGVSDTISIAGSLILADLEIGVEIAHTFTGDLTVTIEHDGTVVSLVNQPGDGSDTPGSPFGCGEDNYDIVLDDEGTGGAIEGLCVANLASPPNYIPNNLLAPFIGTDAQGDWTITVTDTAGFDTGTLVSWTVQATEDGAQGPPPVCTPQGACCQDDGSCDVVEELACTGAYLGDGSACNAPGTPIGVSGAPGSAIPDGDPVGGVSDTINMGMSLTITDVDVDVAISHTFVGDLRVEIEHLGTTVIIVNQMGDPGDVDGSPFGCGEDNLDVTLDDASGTPIEGECSANLSGTFGPNNPLSAFNGMEAAGDWTISVFDTAGFDTGTLDSWGVSFGEQPGESNCPVCGNGAVESGEECDDGNTDDGDCCSSTCLFEDTATVCNASTGVCDPAETCDGAGSCDADVLSDSSTVCRPSTADCDPGENCTGTDADCPADVVITVCQAGTPEILDGCCPAGCNANNDDDCTPICGNGELEDGEQCDDGNNDPGDGCDEVCVGEGPPVPTVSQWGLLVLALMLLVGAKVYFGRRHATA